MKKAAVVLILTLVILFSVVFAASAITDGELDGDGHPFVGLALFYDENGDYMWRCSGTLLSETVFLTAGHCTYSTHMAKVYFDADLMELVYPYDFEGCGPYTCYEGETYAHPEYSEEEGDDPWYMHDAGVIILSGSPDLEEYGSLPEVDQFDQLELPSGKLDKTRFTSVGYGQQAIFTDEEQWTLVSDRVRMFANPFLLQLNVSGITGDYSLLLSNNHATGGTCYGDSGGPNFLGQGDEETNIVAGITSFGMNQNCAGIGGVFRTDRQDVLEFVLPFLED
jgi:hypothetical protein